MHKTLQPCHLFQKLWSLLHSRFLPHRRAVRNLGGVPDAPILHQRSFHRWHGTVAFWRARLFTFHAELVVLHSALTHHFKSQLCFPYSVCGLKDTENCTRLQLFIRSKSAAFLPEAFWSSSVLQSRVECELSVCCSGVGHGPEDVYWCSFVLTLPATLQSLPIHHSTHVAVLLGAPVDSCGR